MTFFRNGGYVLFQALQGQCVRISASRSLSVTSATKCKRGVQSIDVKDPFDPRLISYLRKLESQVETLRLAKKVSSDERDLVKRYTTIESEYDDLKSLLGAWEETKALLQDPNEDASLRKLAEEESKELAESLKNVIEKIEYDIIPDELFDDRNATLEVTPGAGGQEACLFAQEIFNFYFAYLQSLPGVRVNVTAFEDANISKNSKNAGGDKNGIQFASCSIESAGVGGGQVFKSLKHETGVHRVQRFPVTGTKSMILQTSTCSVAVLPQPDESDMKIDEQKDCIFEFVRSSGPGGQNVNVIDSKCRLTHKPSGVVVVCQENRTGAKNKVQAIEKLRQILFTQKLQAEMKTFSAEKKAQMGNMNRNEKIRTYNFNRQQITDHRIGQSKIVQNISEYLEGRYGFEVIEDFREELEGKSKKDKLTALLESQ